MKSNEFNAHKLVNGKLITKISETTEGNVNITAEAAQQIFETTWVAVVPELCRSQAW
jgi:ABC-type branched-subunit amino acid transport system substrate-binding protein